MALASVRSESGASTIEFAFYVIIFVAMCGFLMDMCFSVIEKSHAERVNSSLISILRERNVFYKGDVNLSTADLDQLKKIADQLLSDDQGNVQPYQLGIRMVSFTKDSTETSRTPLDSKYISKEVNGCNIAAHLTSVDNLSKLSPWGIPATARKDTLPSLYPVYEVTLCIPGYASFFHQAMGVFNEKLSSLYIRNAAIPRL